MRTRLQRQVAEALHIQGQVVGAATEKVVEFHMVVEENGKLVAAAANYIEQGLVGVEVNCNELAAAANYNKQGLVVAEGCAEQVVVAEMGMVVDGMVWEKVEAVAVNALHMVAEMEEEVVLYKAVGMVEVVNGLGEEVNRQAEEAAVINKDK